MKRSPLKRFCKKPLSVGIAAAILSTVASQSTAGNYELGDFDIRFTSKFSVGASWRVEDRNWRDNVGISNNLKNGLDFSNYHPILNPTPTSNTIWQGQGSYSNNGDLGNLNFDSGEMFSQLFKGTHELEIKKDNWGVFLRGMYFYDFEMSDGDRAWNNTASGASNDPCRDSKAKEQVCQDVRLLHAYFFGDYYIDDMPFSLRIGQQTIGWGEGLLISHGISEINPIDISRVKAPGAELTEAFIPFGAVWGSLGVTEDFSVEMFYQYAWEETILPAPGTYFSTNDFAGDGGRYNNVQLGFTGNPDMDLDYVIAGLNEIGGMLNSGDPAMIAGASAGYLAYPTKITLKGPGAKGVNAPDDGGQYGVRFSWFLPDFNDTELSLYHINYHSRRPVFSGITANFTTEAVMQDLAMLKDTTITEKNYTDLHAFSKVQLDYPEDIKLYGLSFNTSIGGFAVAGEMSHRQDEPLQIDDVELLFAAMPQQLAHPDSISFRPELDGISQMPVFEPGKKANGFILTDTTQAQLIFSKFWGPSLGADQFTSLLEVGGIRIHDMPSEDELRLNGPGTARNGGIEGKEGLEMAIQGGVETNPFPDDFAWGYRLVTKLDYNNVFAGVNISPRIVFSHDVSGITPDPLFLFVEDRKSISAGVTFDYQSRWSANISYNGFWGGVGTTNKMEDRDYVSFNVKYSL
ncbi:DUF1302 domain-containing protein [Thalassotalea sediminis]|uniref:DUF1302 domain-containing protein n=1 Tax=Thalassotalea sediminis TaxID=1759089 RepID=UPI002573F8CC|nr:DUF1302 domain-containing protein [Thalassotalea sediminis]